MFVVWNVLRLTSRALSTAIGLLRFWYLWGAMCLVIESKEKQQGKGGKDTACVPLRHQEGLGVKQTLFRVFLAMISFAGLSSLSEKAPS